MPPGLTDKRVVYVLVLREVLVVFPAGHQRCRGFVGPGRGNEEANHSRGSQRSPSKRLGREEIGAACDPHRNGSKVAQARPHLHPKKIPYHASFSSGCACNSWWGSPVAVGNISGYRVSGGVSPASLFQEVAPCLDSCQPGEVGGI